VNTANTAPTCPDATPHLCPLPPRPLPPCFDLAGLVLVAVRDGRSAAARVSAATCAVESAQRSSTRQIAPSTPGGQLVQRGAQRPKTWIDPSLLVVCGHDHPHRANRRG
jgi:hypothetical protein